MDNIASCAGPSSPDSTATNFFELPEDAKSARQRRAQLGREKRTEDAKRMMADIIESQRDLVDAFSTARDIPRGGHKPRPPALSSPPVPASSTCRRPNSRHQRFRKPGHFLKSTNQKEVHGRRSHRPVPATVNCSVVCTQEFTRECVSEDVMNRFPVRSTRSPIRSNFAAEAAVIASIVSVVAAHDAHRLAEEAIRLVNAVTNKALISSSSSFGLLPRPNDCAPTHDRKHRTMPRFNKNNPLPRGCRQATTPVR
jgi:hypothetical protein